MEIADVLTRMLLPLARLAIGRGLGMRDVVDPLKRAFLIAAQEDGRRRTDSALSVATGLQRRDVVRLRGEGLAPRAPSAPARIVADWPEAEVIPRVGPAPSFEALARDVRRDVHPRSLLDQLVAAGSVAEEGADVRLLRRAYAPGGGSPEQLAYLADNLHDHGAAAVANVLASRGFFERAIHYEGLTEAQVGDLAARHSAAEMALLRGLSKTAAGMQAAAGPDGTRRLRIGSYAYWEETP